MYLDINTDMLILKSFKEDLTVISLTTVNYTQHTENVKIVTMDIGWMKTTNVNPVNITVLDVPVEIPVKTVS